ncbi:hypothetical protein Tdes44962_MAKER07317 [Teratosphaeria destructans]|uniref:Uncharacterized protein n=1 Tax=Teratosphaeria destructans TaxID=418781 RepID=A0A9W7SZK8_9PEZI|nr:hypothetical protein Tdes44962_MAKER07317 [Teratosphaeria destructans]
MVLDRVTESDEDDEEFYSLATDVSGDMVEDGGGEEPGLDMDAMEPPLHPVAAMQAAFEESIVESATEDNSDRLSNASDAETRRKKLLEAKHYDETWTTRWKQRPNARYHPLLKLMAQVVFGMHLLQQQQAKSNDEVIKILQSHVNEVDSFLERTSEDFDFALADIEERTRHLRLPMQHLEVFDSMLTDRGFRTQLLDGNDKIERIIDRTAKAMHGALMDVQKGQLATQELGRYLDRVRHEWPRNKKGILDVYGAMRGNEQGWMKYLGELQRKGGNLDKALFELGTVIGELSRMAAAASRRNRPSSHHASPARPPKSTQDSPALTSRFSRDTAPSIADSASRKASLNKPLPKEPPASDGASRATRPAHPGPPAMEYERPRASPHSPAFSDCRTSHTANSQVRPNTASRLREVKYPTTETSDLKEFLKNGGPLRSHPPDYVPAPGDASVGAGDDEHLSRSRISVDNGTVNSAPPSNYQDRCTVSQTPADAAKARTTHGGAMIVNTTAPRTSKLPEKQKRQLERDREIERPPTRQSDMDARRPQSHKSEPASRKDSVITASTGFARRMSKRMKNLDPNDFEGKISIETGRNPRSGVSTIHRPSASIRDFGRPATSCSYNSTQRPNTSDGQSTPATAHSRQPSKLGPCPRASDVTDAPTQAGGRNSSAGAQRAPENPRATTETTRLTALPPPPTSRPAVSTRTCARGSSRARAALGSVRNIFHRRRPSQAVFATP